MDRRGTSAFHNVNSSLFEFLGTSLRRILTEIKRISGTVIDVVSHRNILPQFFSINFGIIRPRVAWGTIFVNKLLQIVTALALSGHAINRYSFGSINNKNMVTGSPHYPIDRVKDRTSSIFLFNYNAVKVQMMWTNRAVRGWTQYICSKFGCMIESLLDMIWINKNKVRDLVFRVS